MMSEKKRSRRTVLLGGLAAGVINGLLGSGGGMIAVPTLEHSGTEPRRAHAASVAIMLPLSVVSAAFYLRSGHVSLSQALPYIPGGAVGALVGVLLLRRINAGLLKRIFGAVAVFSGVRLLLG